MDGAEMVRVIRTLQIAQPITDAYEATGPLGAPKKTSGWTNQKDHLLGWFAEIDGPGAYNRTSRTWDARDAYNHFQCAPGLLWLAEALGEEQDKVRQAVESVRSAPRGGASQCAAVRRIIPWERIEELASRVQVVPSRPARHRRPRA